MEKKKRKKLSAKKFTAVLTPLLAVLLVFSVVLTVVTTSSFDLVLRDIFGETKIQTSGAPEGVDAEYYTRDITDSDELQAAEQAYTRKAGAEGFVLL